MKVITFGEMMVVFNPQKMGLLNNVHQFHKSVGGAEGNVAVGLQRLGIKTGYFTRLGNDSFGKSILAFLRSEGIDTSRVVFDGEASTGIYFKEKRYADSMNVYYYRSGSAASKMTVADLDENYIAEADYLHITGITPFLSQSCAEMVFEAVSIAKKNNVLVSFDPNIRYKLMKNQIEGKEILRKLASMADIVMPGVEEGQFITDKDTPESISEELMLLGAKCVVVKLGKEGAYYKTEIEEKYVKGLKVDNVVDSVGAGDGFAAGLLAGLLKKYSMEDSVKLANSIGAMNVLCEGDLEGLPTMDEVNQFLNVESDILR
ncbi:sugar kinase [Priestia megaterium]